MEGLLGMYRPHERVRREVVGEKMTREEFQEECDIRNIMAKYREKGVLTHVVSYGGSYLDVPGDMDFQGHLNFVIAAQDAFESLPAHVRARFGNDPGSFLDFAEDPANHDEMVEMGLMEPKPVGRAEVVESTEGEPPLSPPAEGPAAE